MNTRTKKYRMQQHAEIQKRVDYRLRDSKWFEFRLRCDENFHMEGYYRETESENISEAYRDGWRVIDGRLLCLASRRKLKRINH